MKDLIDRYHEVQLATLVSRPPEGAEWLHEIKFDGYRLIAFLEGKTVKLFTRNGNDWTASFPSIRNSVAQLRARSAVLDLEAVIVEPSGRTSFNALQQALGEGGRRDAIICYIFDLLYLNGENLSAMPQLGRKEKLENLLSASRAAKSIHYSEHVVGSGAEMLAKSCALGLEGIVSKLADAPYRPGRQKSWLKTKCLTRQEFIIVGFSAAKAGHRAIGALYLGYMKGGAIAYAGKVGTGFTIASAEKVYAKLVRLEVKTPTASGVPRSELRYIHWVKPSLLCEVAFVEWTEDGHIRHPSFQGLREDKSARNVKRETPEPVEDAVPGANSRAPATLKKAAVGIAPPVFQGLAISHPDRIIDSQTGLTKGGLAEYYSLVSPFLLQNVSAHPLTLVRCPEGIGGEMFYQRSVGTGLGPDVKPFKWKHKGKMHEYFYTESTAGLLQMVQMGTVEFHPWGTRHDNMDCPDWAIFDLDPDTAVPFEAVKLAALDLKQRLQGKGLECFPRCTGGKGLHVIVPLAGKDPWTDVKDWCEGVALEMVKDVPTAYIATMTKAVRKGKIFVDFFRNDYTATAVADFSVRARPGAPVAVPLEWRELKGLSAPNQFSIEEVIQRIKKRPPAPDRYKLKQRIRRK